MSIVTFISTFTTKIIYIINPYQNSVVQININHSIDEKISLKLFYVLEHFSEIAKNLLKFH